MYSAFSDWISFCESSLGGLFEEHFLHQMLLAHLRLSVSDPPTTASLPHPVTMSLANPQGGSSAFGRHTGRTVDGYVLAVNGVFNCDVKF